MAMFEHHRTPLLARRLFVWRVLKFGAVSLGLAAVSLLIGMLGYRVFEGQPWIDAFVNASMLLGGMGPVGELHTYGGKLFAGFYALYCGLIVIITMGILIAPIFHRFLHHFHMEAGSEEGDGAGAKKTKGHS
jgi:hypothetical protein